MQELTGWLHTGLDAASFPYERVLAAFHKVGKHAVADDLLAALDKVRGALPVVTGSAADRRRLTDFLANALDMWDGRFDAVSYLGLNLLTIPDVDGDLVQAWRWHDLLRAELLADLIQFEVAAAGGHTGLLPVMRPPQAVVGKRIRHGIRAAAPALARLGLTADGPVLAGRDAVPAWCTAVARRTPLPRRWAVRLSMMPVDVVHDEFMFIRVLQTFEAAFALAGAQVRTATAVLDGNSDLAAIHVDGAASVLREAALLWPLVATMQPAAFARFRVHTEGASAIQSPHFKRLESLCRRPDAARLDGLAYVSVPEVRRRVLDGQPTLDDSYHRVAAGLQVGRRERVEQAMRSLAKVIGGWRLTHYRLAARMLGTSAGTGHTDGPPYLKAACQIPVFGHLPSAGGPPRGGQQLACP